MWCTFLREWEKLCNRSRWRDGHPVLSIDCARVARLRLYRRQQAHVHYHSDSCFNSLCSKNSAAYGVMTTVHRVMRVVLFPDVAFSTATSNAGRNDGYTPDTPFSPYKRVNLSRGVGCYVCMAVCFVSNFPRQRVCSGGYGNSLENNQARNPWRLSEWCPA